MNINYKESQIDFLSHVAGKAQEPARARYMAAQVSLSLENLVILGIVAIMVVIFSFSLGIERGKKVALAQADVAAADPGAAAAITQKAPARDAIPSGKAEPKEQKADGQKMKPASSPSRVTMAKTGPGKGGYTLQVASYKGIKSAQREVERLKRAGIDAYVRPSGTYTIVCIGNFQDKEGASDVRRQLKGRYQGTQVRRL